MEAARVGYALVVDMILGGQEFQRVPLGRKHGESTTTKTFKGKIGNDFWLQMIQIEKYWR